MTCAELSEYYELYALGALEEPERSELREHLARGSDDCQSGVRRAAARVTLLASLAPPVDPPAGLRDRVLAGAGVAPRSSWSWMQTWAAVAALVVLGLFRYEQMRRERIRDLALHQAMEQARQSESEAARFKEVLALLDAPETIVRVSAEGAAAPPQGKVFLNPTRGVLLLASNLPPAPEGRIYEMWIIPAGGAPLPAGLFQTEANGTAMYLKKGPVDVAGAGAVAVTLEAAGGAAQPTSQPLIVAPLKKG